MNTILKTAVVLAIAASFIPVGSAILDVANAFQERAEVARLATVRKCADDAPFATRMYDATSRETKIHQASFDMCLSRNEVK